MLDILDTVNEWLAEQRAVALATVVQTWGSAPRGVGAKMGITADMAMIGSVSGGCVETAVVQEALDSLQDGKPRLVHFGVSDDQAWDVGLACGGKISVYVEPLDQKWWRLASDAVKQDRPASTVTILDGHLAGQKILVEADADVHYVSASLQAAQRERLSQSVRDYRQSGRAQLAELDVLVDVHRPRPRLVIIGGAHVAMALKKFAHELGFRVVLIDPRKAFATAERFPDVENILHSYPDKAFEQIGLDADSYLTLLTHDPKIDDPALIAALPSRAPYIGILSSKRTHKKRLERLTKAGVDPSLFERIRTPIGLDIGAKTPEEIAIGVMAEIIAVRNGALE